MTRIVRAGDKAAIVAQEKKCGGCIQRFCDVYFDLPTSVSTFRVVCTVTYRFLESPPPSEKPYHRHCFFFVCRRSRVENLYRARFPGRRTVLAPFPVSRWPPPSPGEARREGSRRSGGNDRAGHLILLVSFCL